MPECAQRWSNIRRRWRAPKRNWRCSLAYSQAIAAPPAELAEQPVSLKNIDYQSIPLVLAAENLRQSAQYGVEKTKAQYWRATLSIQGAKTRYQTSDRSYSGCISYN
ncbi:hypothetical protein ACLB1Q_13145 [Escherichia coli]